MNKGKSVGAYIGLIFAGAWFGLNGIVAVVQHQATLFYKIEAVVGPIILVAAVVQLIQRKK